MLFRREHTLHFVDVVCGRPCCDSADTEPIAFLLE
jgi:hypothetical protein